MGASVKMRTASSNFTLLIELFTEKAKNFDKLAWGATLSFCREIFREDGKLVKCVCLVSKAIEEFNAWKMMGKVYFQKNSI